MQVPTPPGAFEQPPDARMLRLLELKNQLQEIHARLEYLRLMLRLGSHAG